MQLSAEAAAAGGYCKALMGNHELLLIGAKRFGDTPVNSVAGTASFLAAWRLNGGQPTDMERLQDHHIAWMSRLDAVALEEDHLLLHSDTTAYLDYGTTIDDVNDAVTGVIQRGARTSAGSCSASSPSASPSAARAAPTAARELLDAYGGRQVVHGHSPIPYLLGEVGTEDTGDSPVAHRRRTARTLRGRPRGGDGRRRHDGRHPAGGATPALRIGIRTLSGPTVRQSGTVGAGTGSRHRAADFWRHPVTVSVPRSTIGLSVTGSPSASDRPPRDDDGPWQVGGIGASGECT